MKTLIENVRIVGPNAILDGYALEIEDGLINKIEKEESLKAGSYDLTIDGEGKYLAPGFIDIHNHGNSGLDVMDSSKEALDKMAEFHLKNGVTSFLGTVITSSEENMLRACENIRDYENSQDLAELLGVHLEGPFFAVEKKGAQPEKYIRTPDMAYIENIIEASGDRLKMVSLAAEPKGIKEVISFLKGEGVTVALAHSNSSYEESIGAIDYGASVATHLYNGMRAFSHREPGIIGASLLDDRVYCEIIYDRIHVHDAAFKLAFKMKGADKLVLVSDAMRAAGLSEGEYELGGQKVFVRDGAARLEEGNLAGSVLNLNRAVKNVREHIGLNMVDAVRIASLSPAKAIKVDDRKGSIEVGKDADLILIDDEINIFKTLVRGKLVCL